MSARLNLEQMIRERRIIICCGPLVARPGEPYEVKWLS